MPTRPESTAQLTGHLEAELDSQPQVWQQVVDRLPEVAQVLPQPGERVAVLGCGTSWFMGQAYARRRELLGLGLTDAFAASEHGLQRGYDRAVIICRSGTTTEIVEILDTLSELQIPHTSIVATPGTPVAERSQHTILLPEADEKSVVQTRFATANLALLRASLGDDLGPAIAQAQAIIDEDEATVSDGIDDAEQLTFLGRDWTVGLAAEAALKLRESAQFWAESYPAMEYRHGPMSIATQGRAVWAIGEVPPGLAEQVRDTGASFVHRNIDPLAELVRVHRYSALRARRLGLDPDAPRHLTRSIVLV